MPDQCAATQGLDIAARAKQGKLGGFRHVIFLAAFAIPVHGWDLLKTFGGKWPEWFTAGEPYTGVNVSLLLPFPFSGLTLTRGT